METMVKLEGSVKKSAPSRQFSDRKKRTRIVLIITLRRKKKLDLRALGGQRLTHAAYAAEYGAAAEDAALVEDFVRKAGLKALKFDLAMRTLTVSGRLSDIEMAFQITIHGKKKGRRVYRVSSDEISIPASLSGVVTGVFGIDDYPMFERKSPKISFDSLSAASTWYTPPQLASLYGYPATSGKGQCIGIIELIGGYDPADMTAYFQQLNIPLPNIKPVFLDTKTNDGPTTEATMDIQIASSVAPGANTIVYFAENQTANYLSALKQIVNDQTNMPSVISISYASVEDPNDSAMLDEFNEVFKTAAALHITVCVSSGDEGADAGVGDGQLHVYFPACSPFVLACGGTSVLSAGGAITSETVWNDQNGSASGGGVSAYFPKPDYQANAGVPETPAGFAGRGIPDVAADADKNTGLFALVGGGRYNVGGTSASAPMIAGLIARLNEQQGARLGQVNARFYANPGGTCRDILSGNNFIAGTQTGYQAGPGWDACTGLGVPFS